MGYVELHDINKLRTGVLDLVLESSARKIGDIGEDKLYLALRNKINIPDNQILRNVYIPTHNGKTTEIDMIVVSKKGLLVFECKNYSGRIYGNMYSKQWTQYVGKKKYPVPNPFMQNHYHVKCLQEYLKQLAAYQLYRSCQQTRAENGRYTIWAQTIIFSARTVL